MKPHYLEDVKKFYKAYKRLPSYSEMLKILRLASKNAIHKIVQQWIEEDILQKIDNKLSPTQKFFRLPLLGTVKAGYPTAADHIADLLSLDEYVINKPTSSFFLKVSGDSLVDIGIFPDDLVVIEKQSEASSGDIVLALIDREWTLKILRKKDSQVFLEAANKKYPPFKAADELLIFGVVRAVIRKF